MKNKNCYNILMINKFKKLLNEGDKYKIFLQGFFLAYFLIMTLAFLADYFLVNNKLDAYFEVVFIVLAIPLYLYYERTQDIEVGKYGLVILVTLSTYMLLVTNNFHASSFHIIVPLGYFLLFTFRKSMVYMSIHQVIVVSIYYFGYSYLPNREFFPESTILVSIALASMMVWLFGITYYLAVDSSFKKLIKLNEQNILLVKETQMLNETLEERVNKAVEEMQNKEHLMQQQARLAQMGEMISMIAHQWRQPLAAITSVMMLIDRNMEMQKYDLSKEEGREAFFSFLEEKSDEINENIQYLSVTTDDFMNFFNPDTQKEVALLNESIRKALKLIRTSMINKDIEIAMHLDAKKRCNLYQNEVMQVILNILQNASDALVQNNIEHKKVHIRTYDNKEKTFLEISDNAGGIPSAIIEKIFDPYFTTKGTKVGTGLGLYMAKNIIEDHNKGCIEVETIGGKTYFRLGFTVVDI